MYRNCATTLAGRITAFKQQDHFLAGVLDPALGFQQFGLQHCLFVLTVCADRQLPP